MSDATTNTATDNADAPEKLSKSTVHSMCRHLGRSLKGTASSDAALAMHLMKEAEYLKTNGFGDAHEMFAAIATVLDPSLPNKMEIARRTGESL